MHGIGHACWAVHPQQSDFKMSRLVIKMEHKRESSIPGASPAIDRPVRPVH
jgi:hypothetical protein